MTCNCRATYLFNETNKLTERNYLRALTFSWKKLTKISPGTSAVGVFSLLDVFAELQELCIFSWNKFFTPFRLIRLLNVRRYQLDQGVLISNVLQTTLIYVQSESMNAPLAWSTMSLLPELCLSAAVNAVKIIQLTVHLGQGLSAVHTLLVQPSPVKISERHLDLKFLICIKLPFILTFMFLDHLRVVDQIPQQTTRLLFNVVLGYMCIVFTFTLVAVIASKYSRLLTVSP